MGIGIGTALGVSLDNAGMGLAIGVAMGIGLSVAFSQIKKN